MEVRDRVPSLFDGIPGPSPAEPDGQTYDHTLDGARLGDQLVRVFEVMGDGEWRTLAEISALTGDAQSSVSARLRDFRKEKFGAFDVPRRRRGDEKRGIWEYRLGDKGAGDPHKRERVADARLVALRAADALLRFTAHAEACTIYALNDDRPCLCGLQAAKTAYWAARRATFDA